MMGKHSEVTGKWLAQPARRKVSIPTPGGEAEGPRLGVEGAAKEIRAIGEVSGPKASAPQTTPAALPSQGLRGEGERPAPGCREGRGRVPSLRPGCLATCSLRAVWPCSPPAPAPAPVPPPGTGRSASPGGGRGWRGGGGEPWV